MQSGFEILTLGRVPDVLLELSTPPKTLFYVGDTGLLNAPLKVAIIGTRKPNTYAQLQTSLLAKALVQAGAIIVSGGALGTDIIAHKAAMPHTICVSPTSLDKLYPASNSAIIRAIATQGGLIISEYEYNPNPKAYDFLHRNRIVVGLSDIVIIPQADMQSGSLYSANICRKLNKPLFVLAHRIGESLGTQELLISNVAKPIFSIESFLQEINITTSESRRDSKTDTFLDFCRTNPSFEEAYLRYGDVLLEYEIEGKIERINGRVVLKEL